VSPLSYALARALVDIEHIGIVNILAGRGIVPEYVQGAMKPQAILADALELIEDGPRRHAMQRDLAEVRASLGGGGASEKAAREVMGVFTTESQRTRRKENKRQDKNACVLVANRGPIAGLAVCLFSPRTQSLLCSSCSVFSVTLWFVSFLSNKNFTSRLQTGEVNQEILALKQLIKNPWIILKNIINTEQLKYQSCNHQISSTY
jgi:hypothetical protein